MGVKQSDDKQTKESPHEPAAKRTPHWSDHFYPHRSASHSPGESARITPTLTETMDEATHEGSILSSGNASDTVPEKIVWKEANTKKRYRHSPEERQQASQSKTIKNGLLT